MRSTIVCGIDWSRRSWAALRFADAIAARCNARLEVLHIAPPAIESVQRERGERLHDGIRGVIGRSSVPLTVGTGVAAEGLVAASHAAALLVIGRPRTGELRQAWRGGVAASLTRRSACPVIVAPSEGRRPSRTPLTGATVLAAVRGDRDLATAATAACWATELHLDLTLASAIERPPMQAGVAIAAPPPVMPSTPGQRAGAATEALTLLAAELSAVAPDDVRVRAVFGAPGRQLRKLAEAEDACMVVVGPRRHGALWDLLVHSPTARLLRRSRQPVMVCPHPETVLLVEPSRAITAALKS